MNEPPNQRIISMGINSINGNPRRYHPPASASEYPFNLDVESWQKHDPLSPRSPRPHVNPFQTKITNTAQVGQPSLRSDLTEFQKQLIEEYQSPTQPKQHSNGQQQKRAQKAVENETGFVLGKQLTTEEIYKNKREAQRQYQEQLGRDQATKAIQWDRKPVQRKIETHNEGATFALSQLGATQEEESHRRDVAKRVLEANRKDVLNRLNEGNSPERIKARQNGVHNRDEEIQKMERATQYYIGNQSSPQQTKERKAARQQQYLQQLLVDSGGPSRPGRSTEERSAPYNLEADGTGLNVGGHSRDMPKSGAMQVDKVQRQEAYRQSLDRQRTVASEVSYQNQQKYRF